MTVAKSLEGPGAQGQSSPPLATSLLKLCKHFPWVALWSLHLPGMLPPPDSCSHSAPVPTAFLSRSAAYLFTKQCQTLTRNSLKAHLVCNIVPRWVSSSLSLSAPSLFRAKPRIREPEAWSPAPYPFPNSLLSIPAKPSHCAWMSPRWALTTSEAELSHTNSPDCSTVSLALATLHLQRAPCEF